jgi:hypothetical protein
VKVLGGICRRKRLIDKENCRLMWKLEEKSILIWLFLDNKFKL